MDLVSITIGECFFQRVRSTPDSIGICCEGRKYTWKQAERFVNIYRNIFSEMGIKRYSHVAILGINSPEWIFCCLAVLCMGGIAVPINKLLKKEELLFQLMSSDSEFLLYDGDDSDTADAIKIWEEKKRGRKFDWTKEDITKERITAHQYAESAKAEPEDTACILFTSGTSGTPKGVMLSHYSLINNALEMSEQMHWQEKDRMCVVAPLYHCFGLTGGVLCGIVSGAELHLVKRCSSAKIMECIEDNACTVLSGVPSVFLAISKNAHREKYNLSSLKSGIIAGSPLSCEEYVEICNKLSMEKLQPAYGQTETAPCITISSYTDSLEEKQMNCGTPISNVEIKIDETGEILMKGYNMMQGYYGMPLETGEVIDSEGWLHTGDLGAFGDGGVLRVIGRKKDIIIRGGENISPKEVEMCITTLEEIEEVKVVGVRTEVLQEDIAACIILKGTTEKGKANRIFNHCRERLADFKIPKYIIFLKEFPLTSSGKVNLSELKKKVADIIAEKKADVLLK